MSDADRAKAAEVVREQIIAAAAVTDTTGGTQ